MNGLTFSRLPGLARISIALLATSAVFTAGCANMATTAISANSMDSGAVIGGKLHGGNQPVGNATVTLWFVGEGSTVPSIVATTTTANDGTGSFSFVQGGSGTNHFSCPVTVPATDPLVYVVASGGNTLNTGSTSVSNTASVFIAPFGLCSTIAVNHPFVDMSEVTTVATMVALQQYFNPSGVSSGGSVAESFSTDGTGLSKTAMINAMATVSNLVNFANGTAITSLNIPSGRFTAGFGYQSTSVTATPETAKINTLANILSSCINNASASAANCTTLFSNATPPDPATTSRPFGTTFTTATDVLQALYYMLTNPTNGGNLTALYNLSSAAGAPFSPVLASAPTDWTVAISYSSNSQCGTGAGTGTGHLINSVQDLAVDTYGAIWLANKETTVGNLTQLSAAGVPITCIQIGSGANTGIAIDSLTVGSNSNIWLADNGGSNVYRYYPGQSSAVAFPTANPPLAIAADGTGDIYFTSPTDTSLYELPLAANNSPVTPVKILNGTGPLPARVMIDNTSSHAVWTTSGTTYVNRTVLTSPTTGTGFSSVQVPTADPTYGLSITAVAAIPNVTPTTLRDFLYIGSLGSSSLAQFQGLTSYLLDTPTTPFGGLSAPAAVVSDGAMNVWTINNTTNSVVEAGANFQAISGTTGFQKSSTYLGSGRSMVIDQAGNVWIGLDGTNSITEIVGAAVPVYQPYATGLKGGLFQTIP